MACILFWSSAVRVHDSQAYRKMDVTKERISCILELREILLSFQAAFNLVTAAVVFPERNILKMAGERRHPCRTPTVVQSQYGLNAVVVF